MSEATESSHRDIPDPRYYWLDVPRVRSLLERDPDRLAPAGALLTALESALAQRASAELLENDYRSRLADAEDRLAKVEQLAARQRQLLTRMEGSRSWRITSLLRWVTARWQRLRGREPARWDVSAAGEAFREVKNDLTSSAPRSTLRDRPWRGADVHPRDALEVTSMMTDPEKALLYWLARHHYTGEGAILDAGCYIGGSTRALAAGLDGRADLAATKPIYSYDLFRVTDRASAELVREEGLGPGDSLRPLFEHNLGPLLRYCNVVEGDLLEHGWVGEGPIEIAFLDILKSWELNDLALRAFFRAFIPGRTVLVQQDFAHEYCPWVHVTMGYLDSYFELLDVFDWGSAVYLLREPIPEEALEISIEDGLSPGEKITFMDRAIEPVSGEMRGIVEGAKAFLLGQLAGPAAMIAHLDYIEARYQDSDQVLRSVETLRSSAAPREGREAAHGTGAPPLR